MPRKEYKTITVKVATFAKFKKYKKKVKGGNDAALLRAMESDR